MPVVVSVISPCLASNSACKSTCEDSVPVIPPHSAVAPPLPDDCDTEKSMLSPTVRLAI